MNNLPFHRRFSPVSRHLLAVTLLMVAPIFCASLAYADNGGVATPGAAADSQPAPIGQGQSAFPSMPASSSSSMAAPYTAQPSYTPPIGQQPSVIGNQAGLVNPSGTDNPAAQTQPAPATSNVPAAAPAVAPTPTLATHSAMVASPSSSGGINIPSPPPPSAFTNDPNQLAAQAEQAAIQAQAQADADQQRKEQEHNIKSYDKAATGLMPLNPDQIREFMHKLEQTQNAAQFPYEGVPKGETRIATLSLDPGVQPPQINLATGYVTTITMVDATGEPWPIMDVGVGGNFEVSPTQAGTHVVRVMPLTRVGTGDLSVLLKDCPTPVIFRLSSGGPTVDLRYDARIGKLGPGAKPQIIARPRLEAGDETLTMILENAPPEGAKRMKVGGLDSRTKAWSMGDKVYVRTPLSLLSPAWNASVASADGTTVYEIGSAPILLLSDNGAMVRAQISRDDDHDR